jgi:signal transduction histidine kinase
MRALGLALLWGVAAALVMGAGGLFLRHDFAARLSRVQRTHLEQAAAWTKARWLAEEQQALRQLASVCARDLHVERLALELAAGGRDTDAVARAADTLAQALGAPALLLEQARGVATLAGSAGAPVLKLARAELDAARTRHVVARDVRGQPWLVLACARPQGRGALWVARALAAERLRELVPAGPGVALELSAAAREGSVEALALRPGAGEPLVLSLRASDAAGEQLDLALLITVLAAFLLASAVSYLITLRSARHEQALATIERAAARVAEGDLVSTIDVRIDERADRTFRTFDRMTKELRDMRARLAEAEREAAFRDVARRIAHEIKNPLSPIQTAIETLRRARAKERADFGEIFDESTRAILEEVKRMERIVREFGEFARLPKPEPGAIDLGALVRDVVPLYVPEGAELELELSEGAARVRADREQITQVLVNLVKNALDAAHERRPARVRIAVESAPGGTCFSVGDNGPGIALTERERVFEPYFTTKDEGTGLGLAIVKRIVADHGGRIEIEKSPLGGASVRVTLPGYEA